MLKTAAVLVVLGAISVDAKSTFLALIPNGNNVPNPCNANQKWGPVGHWGPSKYGKNFLNGFGKDFKAQRNGWRDLCMLDSDGDGWSNGEELGDPDCKFVNSQSWVAYSTGEITHPGVCEPINHPGCKTINQEFLGSSNSDCVPKINAAYTTNTTYTRRRGAWRTAAGSSRSGANSTSGNSTGPQWKLREGCTCFCLDKPAGGPPPRGPPGGGNNEWGNRPSVDESSEEMNDDDGGQDFARTLNGNRGGDQRGARGQGNNRGGNNNQGNRGGNNRNGNDNRRGGWDDDNSDDSDRPRGPPPGRNGRGGPGGRDIPEPPFNSTAAFTDGINESPIRGCTCSCPWLETTTTTAAP